MQPISISRRQDMARNWEKMFSRTATSANLDIEHDPFASSEQLLSNEERDKHDLIKPRIWGEKRRWWMHLGSRRTYLGDGPGSQQRRSSIQAALSPDPVHKPRPWRMSSEAQLDNGKAMRGIRRRRCCFHLGLWALIFLWDKFAIRSQHCWLTLA